MQQQHNDFLLEEDPELEDFAEYLNDFDGLFEEQLYCNPAEMGAARKQVRSSGVPTSDFRSYSGMPAPHLVPPQMNSSTGNNHANNNNIGGYGHMQFTNAMPPQQNTFNHMLPSSSAGPVLGSAGIGSSAGMASNNASISAGATGQSSSAGDRASNGDSYEYGDSSSIQDSQFSKGTSNDKMTKKERLEKLKMIRSLSVPKDDIRRTYAKIFIDSFNSGDFEAMAQNLQQYCTTDCTLIEECKGPRKNPYLPRKIETHGLQAIGQYWGAMALSMPDCVVTLHETKIRVTADTCSIINSYSLVGTMLYDITLISNEGDFVEQGTRAPHNQNNNIIKNNNNNNNNNKTINNNAGNMRGLVPTAAVGSMDELDLANNYSNGVAVGRKRKQPDNPAVSANTDNGTINGAPYHPPVLTALSSLTTIGDISESGALVRAAPQLRHHTNHHNNNSIPHSAGPVRVRIPLDREGLQQVVIFPSSRLEVSKSISLKAGKVHEKGHITLHVDSNKNICKFVMEYAIL